MVGMAIVMQIWTLRTTGPGTRYAFVRNKFRLHNRLVRPHHLSHDATYARSRTSRKIKDIRSCGDHALLCAEIMFARAQKLPLHFRVAGDSEEKTIKPREGAAKKFDAFTKVTIIIRDEDSNYTHLTATNERHRAIISGMSGHDGVWRIKDYKARPEKEMSPGARGAAPVAARRVPPPPATQAHTRTPPAPHHLRSKQ